ncbi:hypothetical protein FGO68_gene9574 [Halteria grandinella]|uniref:Uncharacterized protein n=1 Tax=Halteria grandinella TaxID=5974 RepID=A0A8J8NPR7_HALGN|nr:hypothetical protein FGO68_gene9574 [Halteria grandinella]
MTSIAANSANKQLADFGSVQKKRSSRPQTAVKKEDIDDSRSDASYISYATSSNFSSVLKRPQVTSSFANQSQISYEDGFPNAEFNAVTEEERARRRKDEKEQKQREFMERTKNSAKEKMRQDQILREKQRASEQINAREKALKAKEYAKKQREIIAKGAGKQEAPKTTSPNVQHVHVLEEKVHDHHAHVHFQNDVQVLGGSLGYPEIIHETSEEHLNDSSVLSKSKLTSLAHAEHNEEHHKLTLIDQFQHIDTQALETIGVASKQDLTEEAIPELHHFSLLQRFRQGKDLLLPEKQSQAQLKKAKKATIPASDKENKWWLVQQEPSGKSEGKQSIDKTRYIKALKVMVQDKGIPSLCICGNIAAGEKKGQATMCASNCQFYKNEKDYERALRDIISSTEQTKM